MGERAGRRPRADAARNRERLLLAAKSVFGDDSPAASLEAVARAAEVGIGTLYRHFPTRACLFEAVYRHEVEQLVALSDALADDPAPVDALRRWLRANVEFVATKKGMGAALAMSVIGLGQLKVDSSERLIAALGRLMRCAADRGELRQDIGPADVLHMMIALCYGSDAPGWKAHVLRLLDVFVDGLRPVL